MRKRFFQTFEHQLSLQCLLKLNLDFTLVLCEESVWNIRQMRANYLR